jgi:hypothetical protein
VPATGTVLVHITRRTALALYDLQIEKLRR